MWGKDSAPFDTTQNGDANIAAVAPAPIGSLDGGIASTPVIPLLSTIVAQRFVRPLGTQLVLADGRKYRYGSAGGSNLVVGNMLTSAAILTTDQDMTPLTGTLPTGFTGGGAVGERAITFTHGAATTVVNRFAEGYVFVTVTPGLADMYKISRHLALASAAAGDQINLAQGNAIRTALTSSSRISLQAHPYFGVIQAAATTLTGAPVGVAVKAITAAQSGWVQTRGSAVILVIGTAVVGANAVSPTGTAGGVGPSAASTSVNVGFFLAVEATTQAGPVFLTIDG